MRCFVLCGLIAVLASACGEETFTCEEGDQVGTYLVSYAFQSGTCGNIPSSVIVIGPNSTTAGCTTDGTASEDGCDVSGTITCVDSESGYTLIETGKLSQLDAAGDRFEGIMNLTIKDSTNAVLCAGVYKITYKRQ